MSINGFKRRPELGRYNATKAQWKLHNGQPYRYGTAWLKEKVPQEVLDFLVALPETDIQPAWV